MIWKLHGSPGLAPLHTWNITGVKRISVRCVTWTRVWKRFGWHEQQNIRWLSELALSVLQLILKRVEFDLCCWLKRICWDRNQLTAISVEHLLLVAVEYGALQLSLLTALLVCGSVAPHGYLLPMLLLHVSTLDWYCYWLWKGLHQLWTSGVCRLRQPLHQSVEHTTDASPLACRSHLHLLPLASGYARV